jgi:hypothetical protein
MSRPVLLGAGFAFALVLALVIIGGGTQQQPASNTLPASSQAPAPTLDPVIPDSRTQSSASPEAPSQATSSHKETK